MTVCGENSGSLCDVTQNDQKKMIMKWVCRKDMRLVENFGYLWVGENWECFLLSVRIEYTYDINATQFCANDYISLVELGGAIW